METVILDDIAFNIDIKGFLEILRLPEGHRMAEEVREICREAELIAKPRVMYRVAGIESRDEDHIVIGGVPVRSRLLRINLEETETVYPFVLSCGMELEEWSNHFDDILRKFWADSIKGMALGAALMAFEERLRRDIPEGILSAMNPGSLEDWPIEEQRTLFDVLGNVKDAIGVTLTDSCMMVPLKSISGIRFRSKEEFVNCQMCAREKCPGRRAPYNEHMREVKYGCGSMDSAGGM
jgi:hypothetical protein